MNRPVRYCLLLPLAIILFYLVIVVMAIVGIFLVPIVAWKMVMDERQEDL